MRKIIVVAVREYLTAVKSKAFIMTMVAMPLLMGGSILVQKLASSGLDLGDKNVAVVDLSDVLWAPLTEAARERNEKEIFEKDERKNGEKQQTGARFILEHVDVAARELDDVLLELSDRVRKQELFAFIVIQKDALDPADPEQATVQVFSNTPTYSALRRWVARAVTREAQRWRFNDSGLDPTKVAWALQSVELDNLGLFTRDAATGDVKKAEAVDEVASFGVPVVMFMLLFGVIMVAASPLIQSVLEEKTQRIAEVLLASLTPFEWMMGKLIGVVGMSLTIVGFYMAGGFYLAYSQGYTDYIPYHLLGWFFAYQILAVLMFGAIFVGVGAACTDHREAQSAVMPVMVLIMLPMMLWINVLQEPNSTFSMLVSLFPPATPMLMMVRQTVPPGVPLWQPALGMLLVLLTTVLCVFAASRIFRVGILMQGKGAKLTEMMRWVFKG